MGGTTTQDSVQVVTGEQPFPGAGDRMIMYSVVTGERPARPQEPNEWVSDDVWGFISRCWSLPWDGRPDVNSAVDALNDAADAAEAKRRKAYAMPTDQGKETLHRGTGMSRMLN